MAVQTATQEQCSDPYAHVQGCGVNSTYLVSNATTHEHLFGAVAELVDNTVDAGVDATQFFVDVKMVDGKQCLV